MLSLFDNPFVECTARDMEYADVVNYWCRPYAFYDGLDESVLMKSKTPIFVEGARGSGKTMLLKHLSYYCQKEENEGAQEGHTILNYFAHNGYVGVYYRFKNDFGKLLAALNCNKDTREEVFAEYFQLYYCREIVLVLIDLFESDALASKVVTDILNDVGCLLNGLFRSFQDVLKNINDRIEKIDYLIRRLKYMSSISDEVAGVITGEAFISKLLTIIRSRIVEWSNINLIILLDEYENIFAFQQTVNTYIKQTESDSGITYRIGMRPESAIYSTNVAEEQLQNGRDYLLMQLRVSNPKEFQRFLKVVAEKRLKRSAFFSRHNLTKIEKILGAREDWVEEAIQAIKNHPDTAFECLNKSVIEKYGMQRLKEQLSFSENPLLEMLNVLWVNRGKTPEYTNNAMNLYLEAKVQHKTKELTDSGRKYYLDYEMKYKYSLLFALLSKRSTRKKYYSFTTFSYLACGSVNGFLSLCRNTFMAIDQKNYDRLIAGIPLLPEIQNKGALDAATEQLDKIRLCEDSGTEMYTFAMNVGEVFGYYHRDTGIQFPETNQFAFENEAELSTRSLLKRDLDYMLKWGVIERKGQKQSISIGRRKGNIYILNKMLAPIFGFSYRTRGGYNFVIRTDAFEQMLSNSLDAGVILALNKKKADNKRVGKTRMLNSEIDGQMTLL